jgi:DnaJ-class molecular chaperone
MYLSDELIECPSETKVCDLCNGKGKILMTIHDWILDEPRTDVIVCLRCKGKGSINAWNKEEE